MYYRCLSLVLTEYFTKQNYKVSFTKIQLQRNSIGLKFSFNQRGDFMIKVFKTMFSKVGSGLKKNLPSTRQFGIFWFNSSSNDSEVDYRSHSDTNGTCNNRDQMMYNCDGAESGSYGLLGHVSWPRQELRVSYTCPILHPNPSFEFANTLHQKNDPFFGIDFLFLYVVCLFGVNIFQYCGMFCLFCKCFITLDLFFLKIKHGKRN